MNRFTFAFLGLFLSITAVSAQSTASAIFLLIAPGAAAGGTGEAHVAAAPDAYASYWNPAALAFTRKNEVVYQRSAWLPNLANDINYNFFGLDYHMPGIGTFGGHLIYLDLGQQDRRGEADEDLGTFRSYMAAATVGFGTQMSTKSSIGINAKIIHQSLSTVLTGAEKGKGVSTDFAFDFAYYRQQFLFRSLDIGLAFTNIGPKIAFVDEDQADPPPTNLKAGIKWRFIESAFNSMSLYYDANKMLVSSHPAIDLDNDHVIGNYDKDGNISPDGGYSKDGRVELAHSDPWYLAIFTSWWDEWYYGGDVDIDSDGVIDSTEIGNESKGSFANELETITHNIGFEYWYSTYFAIRAGFIYDKLGKINNPTFGAGIHYGPYGFDFGYIYGEQGHPLENTMRFSLNMEF
ncbi:MAG: PorV/PorQ family protein [Candidatus Marinimicrobia bacterium]|nr:PorV/PorQ family protein [Candidatus Neomarinimicrobiota bacterium]